MQLMRVSTVVMTLIVGLTSATSPFHKLSNLVHPHSHLHLLKPTYHVHANAHSARSLDPPSSGTPLAQSEAAVTSKKPEKPILVNLGVRHLLNFPTFLKCAHEHRVHLPAKGKDTPKTSAAHGNGAKSHGTPPATRVVYSETIPSFEQIKKSMYVPVEKYGDSAADQFGDWNRACNRPLPYYMTKIENGATYLLFMYDSAAASATFCMATPFDAPTSMQGNQEISLPCAERREQQWAFDFESPAGYHATVGKTAKKTGETGKSGGKGKISDDVDGLTG